MLRLVCCSRLSMMVIDYTKTSARRQTKQRFTWSSNLERQHLNPTVHNVNVNSRTSLPSYVMVIGEKCFSVNPRKKIFGSLTQRRSALLFLSLSAMQAITRLSPKPITQAALLKRAFPSMGVRRFSRINVYFWHGITNFLHIIARIARLECSAMCFNNNTVSKVQDRIGKRKGVYCAADNHTVV